jgi:hypothetical protein
MYRKAIGTGMVVVMFLFFFGLGLTGYGKMARAAEPTVKTDVAKPATMPAGVHHKQGMKHQGKMMPLCPMHQNMMGSMFSKAIVSAQDGGVFLLAGDKLIKYDKDLNVVKEVTIDMDMEGIQKKMEKIIEECPVRKDLMHSEEMMHEDGSMMKKGPGM